MMLYKFLTRLDRNRYTPTVISMLDGGVFVDQIKALDISVHALGMDKLPTFSGLQKLRKIINQVQPDLIQGWMYHSNLAAQIANFLAKHKKPVLWSIHHSIASLRAEKKSLAIIIKLTAALSNKATQVIFSSKKGRAQHLAVGYCAQNSLTIGDNFDLTKYKPTAGSPMNLRASLNLPEETILIGAISRYHPMKDHATFLKAAAKITANYPVVHFILVGLNIDDQNPDLTAQIKILGISSQTHLLGQRQDIPELMASFDIFTSSSAYGESFPNVLGEAMSCQIPCVTTDVGDSAVIVGDTGIVVPPKDSDALAAAWQKLILMDKTARQTLGENARNRIKENFDLDAPNSFVKQYEAAYEQALFKPVR